LPNEKILFGPDKRVGKITRTTSIPGVEKYWRNACRMGKNRGKKIAESQAAITIWALPDILS
jgi:hypothetical protein